MKKTDRFIACMKKIMNPKECLAGIEIYHNARTKYIGNPILKSVDVIVEYDDDFTLIGGCFEKRCFVGGVDYPVVAKYIDTDSFGFCKIHFEYVLNGHLYICSAHVNLHGDISKLYPFIISAKTEVHE